ncbi:MAG: CDP-alcohol phosphatidyltransferase family protein [Solirubrobacterales bacterium]
MSSGQRPRYRVAEAPTPRPPTAGELWSANLLRELRAGRFRPDAWARFLAEALRRSEEVRESRSGIAIQARSWRVKGAAAWLFAAPAAKRLGWTSSPLQGGLIWWAGVCKMVDWHLGMAEDPRGRPRARLGAADAVTLARFWMVPLLPGAGGSRFGLPVLIALGGATDWLDGSLARRRGITRLGRDLDTTADLAFLCAAAYGARNSGKLGPLGVRAIVCRQAIGFSLALLGSLGRSRRPAIGARPLGGALRFGGLLLASAGYRRTGTALILGGCAIPPAPAAPQG